MCGDSRVKEEREEEASRLKRELGSARKALERAQQDKEALERELHVCVCVSVSVCVCVCVCVSVSLCVCVCT